MSGSGGLRNDLTTAAPACKPSKKHTSVLDWRDLCTRKALAYCHQYAQQGSCLEGPWFLDHDRRDGLGDGPQVVRCRKDPAYRGGEERGRSLPPTYNYVGSHHRTACMFR